MESERGAHLLEAPALLNLRLHGRARDQEGKRHLMVPEHGRGAIGAMCLNKQALGPDDILNPGKIVYVPPSCYLVGIAALCNEEVAMSAVSLALRWQIT